MSHFTQVETKINDLVALKAALEELGLAFEEATEDQLVKVRGWKGSTLTAEAKIKASKSYDIGLQLTEEGTYKLVADWYKELNELFPGKFFHIGEDETFELGEGQSKEEAKAKGVGAVYFEHLNRVRDVLKPYNR